MTLRSVDTAKGSIGVAVDPCIGLLSPCARSYCTAGQNAVVAGHTHCALASLPVSSRCVSPSPQVVSAFGEISAFVFVGRLLRNSRWVGLRTLASSPPLLVPLLVWTWCVVVSNCPLLFLLPPFLLPGYTYLAWVRGALSPVGTQLPRPGPSLV